MPIDMELGIPIIGAMDDSQIIDELGGTAKVARLCNVKAPSVSGWRHQGIPQARRQFLELLRPDVFIKAQKQKRKSK